MAIDYTLRPGESLFLEMVSPSPGDYFNVDVRSQDEVLVYLEGKAEEAIARGADGEVLPPGYNRDLMRRHT